MKGSGRGGDKIARTKWRMKRLGEVVGDRAGKADQLD